MTYIANIPPLNEFLQIYLPGKYELSIDGSSCLLNECEESVHGCSHECTDLDNGYSCICPEGMILGHDGKTCYPNSCIDNNCDYGCMSKNGTATCFCAQKQTIDSDGFTCVDYDECQHENGFCEFGCENKIGGVTCTCPDGFNLNPEDIRTCVKDQCTGHSCDHYCHSRGTGRAQYLSRFLRRK